MRLEINFNVCRICLHNSSDEMSLIYQPIVDKEGFSNQMLYQKIEQCGGIKLLANPELPNKICRKCNAFLNVANKFRAICKSSDDYLRHFISQSSAESNGTTVDEGNSEYLQDCGPDARHSWASKLGKRARSDIDSDSEEIDKYAEICLNGGATEGMKNSDINSQKDTSLRRTQMRSQSISMHKTLDISSDGAAVIRVSQRNNHLAKKKEKPEKHICEICGNIYERMYILEDHMRRHRDEKAYECEICKKSFYLSYQLSRHMRKHTGVRPHICRYCKRKFADRSSMVKHERTHRNERPYSCETCGKSFTYSNVLKAHQLTHTGEKAFTCGICDKRFARPHHLRAHLETLQHQNDPRAKTLVKMIKKEVSALFFQ